MRIITGILLIGLAMYACAYSSGMDTGGIILKNFECLSATFSWMSFRASDKIGKIDYTAFINLKRAIEMNVPRRYLYIEPCKDCLEGKQIDDMCNAMSDIKIKHPIFIWIDPEHFPKEKIKARDFLRSLVFAIRRRSDCLSDFGILSNREDWNSIFGEDFQPYGDKELAWVSLDEDPDLMKGWIPFGGWKRPIEKNYNFGVKRCDNDELALYSYGTNREERNLRGYLPKTQ